MTTYHVVATPTNLGTLKSARRAMEHPRKVRVVHSGTAEECYDAVKTHDSNADMNATLAEIVASNLTLPAKVTPNWTYTVVADGTSGEPRKEDDSESHRWALKHTVDSVNDWYDNAIRHFERTAEEMRRKKCDFAEACEPEAEQRAKRTYVRSPVDTLDYTMNELSNARMNLREDLLLKRACELSVSRTALGLKR